ncbi:hypothetical protein HU200_029468 [Digitaria exilis]|uniref:KIB1-4 beta-propeller domain-containing protein n=1 Tax=Digitaria exilis TaxID=1010633 RepID=A0A835ETC7_9POAL|nr:hypothetical protein HU200_029468 [Digitaria exilis]
MAWSTPSDDLETSTSTHHPKCIHLNQEIPQGIRPTELGNALVESPPWAHTMGGLVIHPHFLSRICKPATKKKKVYQKAPVRESRSGCRTHAVEAAEAEVEEGRRYEGEEREEEEQPKEGARREETEEAGGDKARRGGRALGGGEEGERRRLPPAPEEPPHSLRALPPCGTPPTGNEEETEPNQLGEICSEKARAQPSPAHPRPKIRHRLHLPPLLLHPASPLMGAATSTAMAVPRSVSDLPGDVQHLILERIPCSADQASMSLVSRAWRVMVFGHRNLLPPPPTLPLLLLPADSFDARGFRASCALSGGRVHRSLSINPRNARCFGSHDGAWVFLATLEPRRSHFALNTTSGRRHPRHPSYVHGMVIHAAALSTSPEEATCVGAAIVTSWPLSDLGATVDALPPRRLRHDYAVQTGDEEEEDDSVDHVEDVIYLRDVGAENLLVRTPILHENQELQTLWGPARFRPDGRLYDDQHVRARYLVESDGDLLMVFKVFKAEERDGQEADDDPNFPVADYPAEWTELDTLGESYQPHNYPGFNERIYFLDDGDLFDDVLIFGDGNVRRYPCSDNGKWSEGRVHRCFPRSDPLASPLRWRQSLSSLT